MADNPTIKTITVNNVDYDIKDATARSGFAGVFGKVYYNSSSTPPQIEFYTKDATFSNGAPASGQTPIATLDASNFIKDAVVSNVEIKNVTIDNASVSCLVISFNTDAGKNDINIPLTSIFNPSNYYTKTEIDNKGYTTNVGTITGITMNGASKGTSGVVDLGTVITSHQTIKTLDGTTMTGSGDVKKVVYGKLTSGSFYKGTYSNSSWTYSSTAETGAVGVIYVDVNATAKKAYCYDGSAYKELSSTITVDSTLTQSGTNAVQGSAIYATIAGCYDGYDSTNETISFTFPTITT